MALEAQYPQLFSSKLYKNREGMNSTENVICVYGNQMSSMDPVYNSFATAMNEGGFVVDENNNLSRKRPRGSFSFLGEDLSSQIYNQMLDIDRLLVQHMVNARTEISQKRKRFSNQIMTTVNESFSERLKSKDDEIEQLRKLNRAMEERINSLAAENNAWKYVDQSHESAAAVLGANLEQVLSYKAAAAAASVAAAPDDVASCCNDNRSIEDWKRMCRKCGSGNQSVLLLPCRHLCLCTTCGPVTDTCPICKCSLTGSVNVNLS